MSGDTMNKGERDDLRLVRQREKVLKSAAKQRSAELLADFENQMGQEHMSEDDGVWAKATAIAKAATRKAEARCRELGIAKQFAPSLSANWHHRGYGNALENRRAEVRKMAQTQIEAQERKAVTQIELSCLMRRLK